MADYTKAELTILSYFYDYGSGDETLCSCSLQPASYEAAGIALLNERGITELRTVYEEERLFLTGEGVIEVMRLADAGKLYAIPDDDEEE